jgi:hypothetical protein
VGFAAHMHPLTGCELTAVPWLQIRAYIRARERAATAALLAASPRGGGASQQHKQLQKGPEASDDVEGTGSGPFSGVLYICLLRLEVYRCTGFVANPAVPGVPR